MKRSILVLVAAGLVGCATARPILYANPKYNEVGRDGAKHDIADCEQQAKNAGATPDQGRAARTATGVAIGAGAGAAAGAVGGAIWGSPGIGAGAGAASGVVGSLLWTLFGGWATPAQPSEPYRNYVDQCLTDRGYQLVGWK
jgi:outer membrane lipoprotein SlyB